MVAASRGCSISGIAFCGMRGVAIKQQTGRTRCSEFVRLFIMLLFQRLRALAVDVDTDDGSVDKDPLAIVGRDDAEVRAGCNRSCPRHERYYPSKFPTNLPGRKSLRVIW